MVFLPGEWSPTLSSNFALGLMLAMELLGAWKGLKRIDHWAHLGGYTAGIASAEALKYKARLRRQEKEERGKAAGFVDRLKEARV